MLSGSMKKYKEKTKEVPANNYTSYTEEYDYGVIYNGTRFEKMPVEKALFYANILEQALDQAQKLGYKEGTLIHLKQRNNIVGKIRAVYDDPDVAFASPRAFKSKIPEIFDVEFTTDGNKTTRMELFSLKDVYLYHSNSK